MLKKIIRGLIVLSILATVGTFAETGFNTVMAGQAKAFLFTGLDPYHDAMVTGVNRFEKALNDSNTNWDITKWTNQSSISKSAVVNQLNSYANTLQSGDTLFIFYLGHGTDIPDQPPYDEGGTGNDGRDEVLVLGHSSSNYLVDDELYEIWQKFAAGVSIVFITNSCQNGTVHRFTLDVPATYAPMAAGLIHIASSSDFQNTAVADDFSNNLADSLDSNGQFQGSYYQWYQKMKQLISYSTPQFQELGTNAGDITATQAFHAVGTSPGPNPNSCVGICGQQAPGGCWCDSKCAQYNDCCPDKVDACGP